MKNALPRSWMWVKIGELIEPSDKKAEPSKLPKLPYIGLEHIEKETGKLLGYGDSSETRSTKTRFYRGDLLYGKLRPYLNKVVVVDFEGLCSTDILVFQKSSFVSNKYLVFRFLRGDFVRFANQNVSGVQHPRVNFKVLSEFKIPLPPLNEQKRIVAKVEALFAGLEAGERALKKVKAQLKRYRQAVLKHAMEGKLTEKWRKENKIKESWEWTTVGDISKAIQYGTSEKANNDPSGIPVLRMGNIQDGRLIFENLKYFQKGWKELKNFQLNEGDVLFNRTNSAELVGKTAVYKRSHFPAVFASYLIRVKVNENIYLPEMLSFFINSFFGRKYILSVVSQQVGQANVNGTKLSQMPIPLPPLAEQEEIVKEIERRFSVAEEVEKIVEQSLKQAERLRQSILKRAFEGKLVPQDVNDEPAEKLLERIKAEKEKHADGQKKRKRVR